MVNESVGSCLSHVGIWVTGVAEGKFQRVCYEKLPGLLSYNLHVVTQLRPLSLVLEPHRPLSFGYR